MMGINVNPKHNVRLSYPYLSTLFDRFYPFIVPYKYTELLVTVNILHLEMSPYSPDTKVSSQTT